MAFKPEQLKTISEFLNMIAAAWFTAGIITPIFTSNIDIRPLLFISFMGTLLFLSGSVYLIKDYESKR